ncbi:MAG: hypothetical protein CMA10_04895 [Euryarchaeota archaeon]|nr:hypothetical protein [Euryarchaeota archaeon]
MFGMQDPSQTLLQIERYMQEGRLELSEVMATQFCDMMMANKKRDPQQQIFFVKGLRLMCDVYLLRGKANQSASAIKRMHKERKILKKILVKNAPAMLAAMQPEHEDYLRAGRLFAAAGKTGAAKKSFATCESLVAGHLPAAIAAVQLIANKKHVERLIAGIDSAGAVIQTNDAFQLNPEHAPPVLLDEVMSALSLAIEQLPSHGQQCSQRLDDLKRQQAAILAGEQAANERLQSALDNLKPKHDYYQYG